MKRSIATLLAGVGSAAVFAGCVSTPLSPDLSAAHPANPHAAQSPVPPLQPGLLAITNRVMVKPVTEPAPEHHHVKKPKEEKK